MARSGPSPEGAPAVDPFTVDTKAHSRSEATRLLCAGAYLDAGFRDTVLTELVEHPERTVPPSLGHDVATVLRHCLRARGLEVRAAGLVLVVLATGTLTALIGLVGDTGPDASAMGVAVLSSLGLFAVTGLMSWGRRSLLGQGGSLLTAGRAKTRPVGRGRRLLATPWGLANFALAVVWTLPGLALVLDGSPLGGLAALIPPLLLTAIGVWHRLALSRVLWTELARGSFTGEAPTAPDTGSRADTLAAIDQEQFSRLVLYNEDTPFLGAGTPYKPWSLALELKRRPDAPQGPGLDGRRVLDLIAPQLAKLAEATSRTSRDRLKDLELQECAFLPADLPEGTRRTALPYGEASVREHIAQATGEGAEQRRHFLRIRVGGWEEEIVTTVFVRVHTQGDLLILEVLPYVLPPLLSAFHEVDALTGRSARFQVSALVTAPAVTMAALAAGASAAASRWREWRGSAEEAAAQAPRISVRELGARDTWSVFQEMDVARYVRTIQDRITSGTHQALADAGYMTDEFQQQIITINRGGVFIGGSMAGAIATGDGARAHADLAAAESTTNEGSRS